MRARGGVRNGRERKGTNGRVLSKVIICVEVARSVEVVRSVEVAITMNAASGREQGRYTRAQVTTILELGTRQSYMHDARGSNDSNDVEYTYEAHLGAEAAANPRVRPGGGPRLNGSYRCSRCSRGRRRLLGFNVHGPQR